MEFTICESERHRIGLRSYWRVNRISEPLNSMTRDDMRARTKAYANRIVKVCEALPDRWVARTLGMQLLRSATSVGANYRAVCRAKSDADFLNKLRTVEEECDESLFWMELLVENNLVRLGRLKKPHARRRRAS